MTTYTLLTLTNASKQISQKVWVDQEEAETFATAMRELGFTVEQASEEEYKGVLVTSESMSQNQAWTGIYEPCTNPEVLENVGLVKTGSTVHKLLSDHCPKLVTDEGWGWTNEEVCEDFLNTLVSK